MWPMPRLDVQTADELEQALAPQLNGRFGPDFDSQLLGAALAHVDALYVGRIPGCLAADTPYHDLKHSLDTALVAARIADGMIAAGHPVSAEEMLLTILGALYHDVGYIRRDHEREIPGGALTEVHVGRSAAFFRDWLSRSPLAEHADAAGAMLHYTGYEESVSALDARLPEPYRRLGRIIGTADLISQMADRYYLERCRDALFVEFSLTEKLALGSAAELLQKTPAFMAQVLGSRMERDLDGYYVYLADHFGCAPDPYMAAIGRSARFIGQLAETGDFRPLRRDSSLRTAPRCASV